jgi:hypothetical protein
MLNRIKEKMFTGDFIGADLLAQLTEFRDRVFSVKLTTFNAVGDGVTSDQVALENAVQEAKATGKWLYFPDGTYLSTASIPDFHLVPKMGQGIIKRGDDLFYISPTAFQTNRIYLKATGGSNLNDGLSASQPFAAIQNAVDILPNYAKPMLGGTWEFSLTAGTFTKRAVIQEGLKTLNPIRFIGAYVGGHPNIPTTIISEGAGKAAVALLAKGGTNIYVQDILFTGFNGSSSSCGVSVADYSQVWTVNCHFTDCFYGVSGVHHTATDVKGGIFTTCGFLSTGGGTGGAIRSLQLNNHEIGLQNAGNNDAGPFFRGCNYGLYAQELSTGHSDWCTYEDCNDAILARVMARVNMDGSLFKRNKRALRGDGNTHFYLSSNVQFGTGVDKNEVPFTLQNGAEMTSTRIFGTQDVAYSTTERAFDTVYVNQSFNTAANNIFYTETLNAPFFDYTPSTSAPIKKLHYRIFGTITGTTDAKKITARLGNNYANSQFSASETGAFVAEGFIYFVSNTEQFINMKANTHIGSNRSTNAKATNNMSSDVTLTLEAYVFNTADSVKIEVVELNWAG